MSAKALQPNSAWAPFASPVFRALWIAATISNLGSWMESVGAQWFLVAGAAPAILVALVQTAGLLPTAIFSLPAGVLADSMDRRKLLIVATVGSTIVSAALAIMTVAGGLTPVWLLTFTLLLGVSGAFVGPAWQAIQPDLVPREQVRAAAGLGGISVNASRAIGPAIAGVLVSAAGPSLVFALDAVSFAAIVVALFRWRPTVPPPHDPERFVEAIRAGTRYVLSAGLIRRILLRSALFALPASGLWALLPFVATRLHFGSAGYGLLLGLLGAGAAGVILVLPSSRRFMSDSVLLAVSAAVFGLGTALAAIAPAWVVFPALVLAGAAWTGSLTVLNSSMQLTLAKWVRARGLAVYVIVFFGINAIGSAVAGALADEIGTAATLLIFAAGLAIAAVSVTWWPLLPETSEIDRETPLMWSTPALIFTPDEREGPITVSVTYLVGAENRTPFIRAMQQVRLSRKRTGATRWRLYRDGGNDGQYIETFDVPSWEELRRQRSERLTGKDREFLARAADLASELPTEDLYFPAGP
jgi:MFS family permease